ncbi:type II secretion system protein N [Dokdonella sp.]|uniref:type II secretion system protein N n=1 Tax=Dokdonella sp. TaxID=2291710 RepID=UPI001B181561|nr:type II secretion system protein N [Dokdonella sp.]MBO9663874.1 type II secretion system protein N [Dokdonella sp.]
MRTFKILLLLVVLGLLAAGWFFWKLPASFAVRYGANYLGPVTLTGVSGTLWDGHADGVSVLGRDLGEIEWRAQKAPLFDGRFVADVRIKGADVDAAGTMTRNGDGSMQVHEMRFSVPAELLATSLDLGGAKLLGTISGVVNQAKFATTALSDASGNARWSGAGVAGQAETHLPDILGEFASQPDGSIGGQARDDGSGNLAVDGNFKIGFNVLDAQATLSPRNGDEQVAEMLRRIGEPQPDGSTRFVVHGQMIKFR